MMLYVGHPFSFSKIPREISYFYRIPSYNPPRFPSTSDFCHVGRSGEGSRWPRAGLEEVAQRAGLGGLLISGARDKGMVVVMLGLLLRTLL